MPDSVVVVGAGAFGGWTALNLLRRGTNVILVDQWGPGNSQSSSGGESRVLRYLYGQDHVYSEMTLQSVQQWTQNQETWGEKILEKTGQLWLFQSTDDYARVGLDGLAALDIELQELSLHKAKQKFPQFNFDDIRSVFFEPDSGLLHARHSCQIVCKKFVEEGGRYIKAAVRTNFSGSNTLSSIELSNGERMVADQFVFACGSWLGKLFPTILGNHILPTRQEVHYFSLPDGSREFDLGKLPTWVDVGQRIRYGLPYTGERGLKVGDDTRGSIIDPTTEERRPTSGSIQDVRSYLEGRIPSMKNAPLNESRVCQYENSPDGHLIVDKHPEIENVWIVGGGSGHGFKLAPALGKHVANCLLSNESSKPTFSLQRLGTIESRTTQFETK